MAILRIPREGRQLGLLLAASGMLLISTDSLFIRIANTDGWTIAFMSSLFSTPIMWAITARNLKHELLRALRNFYLPLLLSALLGAIATTSFILAITHTEVANVVAIIASAPLFAAAIAQVFIGERASIRTWLAIFGVVIGILVIVTGSLSRGGILGDLLALLAIVAFATNLTIWRKYPNLSRSLVVALTSTFTVLITSTQANPSMLDRSAFLATLAMGCFFGPTARFCMATATRYASTAEVSMFAPVETVCASAWVWLVYNEVPPTATFFGAAIVFSALTYGVGGSINRTTNLHSR